MKQIYNLFLMITLAVVSLAFTGCSNDDDDGGIGDASKLEGTWVAAKAEGWYKNKLSGGAKENFSVDFTKTPNEDEYADYMKFVISSTSNKSFSLESYDWEGSSWSTTPGETAHFHISGNYIVIDDSDHEDQFQPGYKLKVALPNSNTMVVEDSYEDEEESSYLKVTFQRQ